MSKVYTVKSNARRDARKQGLDPDLVVPVEGGFVIGAPAKATASVDVRPEPRKRGAATDALLSALRGGWAEASTLMAQLGWQAHTLRGAISTLAKKQGLAVERRRVDGVTSYRVAP